MNPVPRLAGSLVVSALLTVTSAQAQVQFSFALPHAQVLQHEVLPVIVTVRNSGTTALKARGEDAFVLGFEITDPDGVRKKMRSGAAPWVPPVIEPGREVTFTNDLQGLFHLERPEALAVAARLQAHGRTYATAKNFVEIQPGLELARITVPAADGSTRVAGLRVMNRQQRDRLFLRLDDESAGLCYGVIELGRYIRVGQPTLEVDGQGRVHILHLSGPNQFTHSVYTLNGDRVLQRTVTGDTSSVRLAPDAEQGFRLTGEGASPSPAEPMVQPLPLRRSL